MIPGTEGLYVASVNRYTSPRKAGTVLSPEDRNDSSVPPNVHDSKVFLIKLQLALLPAVGHVMIYDRQRTFGQVFFIGATDPQLLQDLTSEMKGPRGGYGGIKMYRFAKRISDWELSLCLDKEPQSEIKW